MERWDARLIALSAARRRPGARHHIVAPHAEESAVTRGFAWRIAIVSAALAAATAIGWWAVPVAAAVFGAITRRDQGGPVVAGAGAIIAWGGILVYDAFRGPVGIVAQTLGGVLQVRPVAVYVLTLCFAGLLAVCAALVARTVARAVSTVADAP
jgi:hypothetical protein